MGKKESHLESKKLNHIFIVLLCIGCGCTSGAAQLSRIVGRDSQNEESGDQVLWINRDLERADTLTGMGTTTDSVTFSSSSGYLVNIPMNPNYRAEYVFTIHSSNETEFVFEISKNNFLQFPVNYMLSAVVEKISCRGEGNYLVLEGMNLEEEKKSVKYCLEEDNDKNNFQMVEETFDEVKSVKVRAEGDWVGLSAQIVINVYYEVKDGCHNCGQDDFCCGSKDWCSTANRRFEHETTFRCIPRYFLDKYLGPGRERKSSLICNRHPNCGFYCNFDESLSLCSVDVATCVGRDCHLTEIAIRIAVLILFCFFIPPLVILFLCRFQAVRKLCDRVNDRLTIATRRTRNENESRVCRHIPPVNHEHEHEPRSHMRRMSPLRQNPADDPPPSYDEYLKSMSIQKTVDVSSPSAPQLLSPLEQNVVEEDIASGGSESRNTTHGIVNNAFVHSDSH